MNKIPVYLCIAILLGQVMLFSGELNAFHSTSDSEFDIENTALTSGRDHTEDTGWVIETVETSSSQASWADHAMFNSLAVDSNGMPHITYLSALADGFVINHTSFDGQTWNFNTAATSSGSPCLALDSSDTPHVGIYTYYYSSSTADFKLATPSGQDSSSWTLEMIDNSSSNVGSNCDMKVGPNGDIYAVYWDYVTTSSSNQSLKFAHHDGNSWTTSILDSDGGSDSSLQIDALGNLHVSYIDLVNGGLKYGFNNGQGWVLSTIEDNGQGRGNSLVLDSNNDPHVSYFDNNNNRLRYASLTGTSWSISTVETGLSWGNNSTASQTDTSIGIDSSDNVHISYYNAGLKYAFYDGTSWDFTLIDTVENIQGNTNLIVDDEQRIHISYHDNASRSLKYATFEESQESQEIWDLSIVDFQADVGEYSSIVLDSNDDAHISYFDASSKDLKYATDVSGQWTAYTIDSDGDVGYGSSIAIDSNDALHISYDDSTNGDLKYATNVNGTWEISTIESQGNVGAYSSIGVNSYDKVHISYYDATNGNLRHATNQYSNGEWSLASVATSGNVGHHTSLVIDSANTVHISYIDYDDEALHYAENTWGPSGWVTTVIDSGSNSIGSSTSIAVDDSNTVHISYFDVSDKDLKYATDESGSWVTSLVDEAGEVGDTSSITTDSEGVVHISYFDDTNENLKHATNINNAQSGPNWTIMTVDSSGAVGEYSSIAFDSEDRAHISYHDSTNSDLKYATSEGPQSPWSEPFTLGTDASSPKMVFDSNDNYHVVYSDSSYNFTGIKYTSSINEGIWSTPVIIAAQSLSPDIAIDSSDNLHVSYHDLTNGSLNYIKWSSSTSTWGNSVVLDGSSSSSTVGGANTIKIDSDGHIHITYYDSTADNLKYIEYFDGQGYWSNPIILDNRTNVGMGPSLAIDSEDNLHVAYIIIEDANSNCDFDSVGYMRYDNLLGSWSNPVTIDCGGSPSLALDSNDNLHVSYVDDTNFNLMYTSDIGHSGTWNTPLVLDNSEIVGFSSSLGIDSNDNLHVAYYDYGNSNLGYLAYEDSSWTTPFYIHSDEDIGGLPNLAIDSDDVVHIAYVDITEKEVVYIYKEDEVPITDPSDASVWIEDLSYSVNPSDTFSFDFEIHTNCDCDVDFELYVEVFYALTSLETIIQGTYTISDSSNIEISDSWTTQSTGSYDFKFQIYDSVSSQNLDMVLLESISLTAASDSGDNGSTAINETIVSGLEWLEEYNETVYTVLTVNSAVYDLEEDRNYTINGLLYYSGNNTEIHMYNYNVSGEFLIDYTTITTAFPLWYEEFTRGVEYCLISKLFYSGTVIDADDKCLTIPLLDNDDEEDDGGEDFDGDGVNDEYDHCYDGRTNWNSTAATDYDSDGCQDSTEDWDDDNDGIDDQEDMCPTGSLDWYAFNSSIPDNDYDGCRDSDEDLDDDDDGYLDTEDTCPVSRRGAVVDDTGCETSFPDEDGDGVADDYDACENTDLEKEIDWRGCVVWEDQDNDGVHDDDDDCVDTPEDSTVDDNGCVADISDDDSDNNSTGNSTGTGNQTDNSTGNQTDNQSDEDDEIEPILDEDWYTELPVIGSVLDSLQTQYGQYTGLGVLILTVLGYLYRAITLRSEYKMSRRVKKFKKQIRKADSGKQLRRIQEDLEKANDKRLLPQGALGDLLSLIELRAEDLGLTDFISQESLVDAGISHDDLMAGVDALNQAREDLANAQFTADEPRSQPSRGPPPSRIPKPAATATLKGSARGGGVKRPSYHPKDLNRDGSVDAEDHKIWEQMTPEERAQRRMQSAGGNANIASQVVGFSKLPQSLKARCHCGKKKAYGKCCFKKDPCPCGNGKKFYKCCAKERGY